MIHSFKKYVISTYYVPIFLQESELTRLPAKISGHERAEDIKFLPAPFTSPVEIEPDIQDSKFAKHSHTAFFKCRKLRRSISASDLSFRTRSDEDLSEELLQDLKKMQLKQPSTLEESQKDLTYTQSDSFKPLPYDLEDDSSENNDFSTLSGMLKYINKEVRVLKKSSMQTGAGSTQVCISYIRSYNNLSPISIILFSVRKKPIRLNEALMPLGDVHKY